MRQSKVDRFIDGYCRNEGIVLLIDPKLRKDDGLCYPPLREIHLAKKYTSSRIKLAIFLHEAGHIAVDRRRKKPSNIFECEMMSWQYAINTYKRFFGKFFSRTQTKFMLKCLTSYCRSQHEFRRVSGRLLPKTDAV